MKRVYREKRREVKETLDRKKKKRDWGDSRERSYSYQERKEERKDDERKLEIDKRGNEEGLKKE